MAVLFPSAGPTEKFFAGLQTQNYQGKDATNMQKAAPMERLSQRCFRLD
jgi:hypothetical protein